MDLNKEIQIIENIYTEEDIDESIATESKSIVKENLVSAWESMDRIIEANHLDLNDENLEEFSKKFGSEYVNIITKQILNKSLDQDNIKLFNLTMKTRITNLAQLIVAEKLLKEATNSNSRLLRAHTEKTFSDISDKIRDNIKISESIVKQFDDEQSDKRIGDFKQFKEQSEQLNLLVKKAENLKTDFQGRELAVINGINSNLDKHLEKILEEKLIDILDKSQLKRLVNTNKIFHKLYGAAAFGILMILLLLQRFTH